MSRAECLDCGHPEHALGDCLVAVVLPDCCANHRCRCGEDVRLLMAELADHAWDHAHDERSIAADERSL